MALVIIASRSIKRLGCAEWSGRMIFYTKNDMREVLITLKMKTQVRQLKMLIAFMVLSMMNQFSFVDFVPVEGQFSKMSIKN